MRTPLRVLVLEDDEPLREVMRQILVELEGGEAAFAQDGAGLLALYAEAMRAHRPFDVVLMDLLIRSGMGGRDTIGPLLEMDPGAKVVVFSGSARDDIMHNYARHGFRAAILKPFDIEHLVAVLHSVAGR